MASSSVSYPVANGPEEQLLWADQEAAADERVGAYSCVGCDSPMTLRAGTRRPHFAHKPGTHCSGGETALHATAIRVLAETLTEAMSDHAPYPVDTWCEICFEWGHGNLAKHRGGHVLVDTALAPGARPDITVVDRAGKPRFVIEVIVTHAPEQAALAACAERSLPVICVWPAWDTLGELRAGLRRDIHQGPSNDDGIFMIINPPCRGVRHPRHPEACSMCGESARHVVLETSVMDCYRCHRKVPVVNPVVFDNGGLEVITASSPDLEGIDAVASRCGAILTMTRSQMAGTTYLMHHCPTCRSKQGDNFVYHEGELDLTRPRLHYYVCPNRHWTRGATQPWPAGGEFDRIRMISGGWGTDLNDEQARGAIAGSGNTITTEEMIRRMVWGPDS